MPPDVAAKEFVRYIQAAIIVEYCLDGTANIGCRVNQRPVYVEDVDRKTRDAHSLRGLRSDNRARAT